MKTCSKCKTEKNECDFIKRSRSKDGLHTMCKECTRKIVRNAYHKNSTYYIKKKQEKRIQIRTIVKETKEKVSCMDCGKFYPHYVMDFDHRDRTKKQFNISAEIHWKGLNQILEEIEKCDIVCANCHRIRTYNFEK